MADESILTSWLQHVIPHHCYDEMFIKFNLLDVPCLKIIISKLLGFGIIAGSVMVKLPQIIKILSSASAEGIILMSVLMELTAITASMVYSYASGFPFSAWGEGLFLSLQTVIIGGLVVLFNGSTVGACILLSTYALLLYILMSGFIPLTILWFLTSFNIPIVVVAKSIQGWKNYKNQNTGQLSAITLGLLFFGSLARIFTSIQETGDNLLIFSYIVTSAVNGMIFGQIIYYWNSGQKKRV